MGDSKSPVKTPLKKKTSSAWLAKFGIAGFLFFFIKGLLWLIIPLLAVWGWWE